MIASDAALADALRQQIAALERVVSFQDKMIAAADKMVGLQGKAIDTYRQLAATAEERAERAQKWETAGGVASVVLGLGVGLAAGVLLAK